MSYWRVRKQQGLQDQVNPVSMTANKYGTKTFWESRVSADIVMNNSNHEIIVLLSAYIDRNQWICSASWRPVMP